MRSFAQSLLRDHRVRFLAVGATNTLIGYLVFSALTLWVFGLPYQPRLLLSLAAASLVLAPVVAVFGA